MRRLILACFLMLVAVTTHAAPADLHLSDDSAARWVPFTLTSGNQIRFALEVNGKRASAILDTGVSVSVASTRFARAAGLRITARGNADAIGGTLPIGWAKPRSIRFGGLSRDAGRIAVAALRPLAIGAREPVDMLIGSDLLSPFALDIDYDAHRFRLLPSGRMPFRGTSAPLSLSRRSNVYLTRLMLGGKRVRPVLVDTGDGAAVTVADAIWAKAGPPASRLTTAVAFGLGGTVETRLTVVDALRVGQLSARHVEVRIEDDTGFSAKTGTAGRIGSAFLARYRVLLDPRAGHIVFTPGARADRPPVRSTSGLLVGLDRDRLQVLHVMRGSPAAKTGWRDGDTICRVDGAPVAEDGTDTSWSAGPPGQVVELGMCDGTERTLELAHFY